MNTAAAGAFAGLLLNLAEEHERAVAEAVSHSAHDLRLKNASLHQEIQELKSGSGKWLECMRCRDRNAGANGACPETPAQKVLKLAREELNQALLKYRRQVPVHEKEEDFSLGASNTTPAFGSQSSPMNSSREHVQQGGFGQESPPGSKPSARSPPKRSFTTSMVSQIQAESPPSSVARGPSYEEVRRTSRDSLESIPEHMTARRASEDSLQTTKRRMSGSRSSDGPKYSNNALRRASKDSLETTKERRRRSQESEPPTKATTEAEVDEDTTDEEQDDSPVLPEEPQAQIEEGNVRRLRAPTPPPSALRRKREEAEGEKRNSRLHDVMGNLTINTKPGVHAGCEDGSPKVKPSILKDCAGTKSCSFGSEAEWGKSGEPSSPRGEPPQLEVRRARSIASVCFSDAENESLCGSPGFQTSPYKRPASEAGRRAQEDTIRLHNVWKRSVSFGGGAARRSHHSERSEGFLRRSMRKSETAEAMTEFAMHASWLERTASGCISHPGSPKRVFWDLLGIFLVTTDVVLFPFQVFGRNENEYTSWITTAYWTVSIPMSFFVGFQQGGIIEMRPRRIAEHYAKSWLTFDVIVVSLDWTLSIAGMVGASAAAQGSIGSVRFLKVLRFLRVARLLRLWKVRGVLNDLIDRVQSEAFLILVGIVKLIVMIVLVNHLIACTWYGIGTLNESERNWLYVTSLIEEGIWYRYFTSLHWSLTQFTPASMEVVPQNVYERIFAVCVLLFAMVTFSSFISSITNAMTQLRNLNAERNHQLSVLRQYLTQNHISGSLTVRIWGCVQKAVGKSKKRIHEPDVLMMQALPWQLRMDVLEEIYAPLLAKHAFFLEYGSLYGHQVRRIYENAVQEVSLAMGQKLFTGGEAASSMFFILTGVSSYTRDSILDTEEPVELVDRWVCEAVLWLRWKHNGQFVAKSHAEFVGVVASEFHVILKDNRHAIKYARNFAAYFKKYPEYLSDAYFDDESISTIVKKAFQEEEDDCDAFGKVMSNKSIASQKSQKVIQSTFGMGERRRRSSFGGILQALKLQSGKKEDDIEALFQSAQDESPFKAAASTDSAESHMTSGASDDSGTECSSDSGLGDDSDDDNGLGSPSPMASPLASVELGDPIGRHESESDTDGNGVSKVHNLLDKVEKVLNDEIASVTTADITDPKLSNILPEVKSSRKVSDGDLYQGKLVHCNSPGSSVQQAWH